MMKRELVARLERIEAKLDQLIQMREAEQQAWFSIKEVAARTGLSASHIRRALKASELPASNNGSNLHPIWRIARNDLDEWMKSKMGGTRNVPPKARRSELVTRYFPDF